MLIFLMKNSEDVVFVVLNLAVVFVSGEAMTSKLPQLQTKLAQSSQLANAYFKQLLERNKQYIQEPPTVDKCQTLANQLFYTRLARFFTCSELYQVLFFVKNSLFSTCHVKLST